MGNSCVGPVGSVWIWFDNKAPSVCSQAPYVTRGWGQAGSRRVEMGTGRYQDGMARRGGRARETIERRGERG